MLASGSVRHQDAHRDDIGFYIALPSLLSVMELSCATGPLGSCKSKTSAEANNRIHLLKTKVGREWERETASLNEREGGKEGTERDRHRESEGEAERVR